MCRGTGRRRRRQGGLEIQMLKLIRRRAETKGWGTGSFTRNPSYSWLDSRSCGMLLRVWPGEWDR